MCAAREERGRWRAVWHENGQRQQCEAATEEKLAAKLEKVTDTQRRLCEWFAAPVIDAITCQDIKTGHMQKVVNTAPTPSEGERVRRTVSALVTAGLDGGYLANSRLAKVHWQAGGRPLPAPRVSTAGESGQ